MRKLLFIAMTLVFVGKHNASAQTLTNAVAVPATNPLPATVAAPVGQAWSFSASAYTYVVPDGRDYVQPTVTADRDRLHLEARYNYEALDTASVWLGYNFHGGEKLAWEITPMLGGIFGDVDGVAPGYRGSLSWWKLQFYSEGEYVYNTDDSSESYFYNWSELTLTPVKGFRIGLVTQRTRAYETEHDIQYGFLVGCALKRVDLSAIIFNADEDKPTFTFTVGLKF